MRLGRLAGDADTPQRPIPAADRAAAWELYVELVTRVAVIDLGPEEGLLREALTSLHSLFGIARAILGAHGAGVQHVDGEGMHTVVGVTVAMLNGVLRPVLSVWHPLLLDHEGRRPPGTPVAEHERSWRRNAELRDVLAQTRVTLVAYARLLADMAGKRSTD